MVCPVVRSYQCRFRCSVASPSWTIRLPDRSSGSASPRFSRQSRSRAGSSSPMMIRASEPPIKVRRRSELVAVLLFDVVISLSFSAHVPKTVPVHLCRNQYLYYDTAKIIDCN